jgi:polyhydroxyalkanoate synthesis regulator phasin
MPQNELFKRYLEAGMQFSQMTRDRAEAIVRDLVKAGEVQAEQTQTMVAEVMERSRKNTERFVEQVQAEVRKQLAVAEYVTKDVVTRLQSQIDELRSQLPGPVRMRGGARKAAKKAAPAKKGPAKKKSPAKKRAPAKKAAAKKSDS